MVWVVRPCDAPPGCADSLGGRLAGVQVVSASLYSEDEEISLDHFRGGAARRVGPGCVAACPGQGGGSAAGAWGARGRVQRGAAASSVVGAPRLAHPSR